jgi:hypothetical protein
MPSGYDMYSEFYNTVTSTQVMERLLDITGALSVISGATILAPVDAVSDFKCSMAATVITELLAESLSEANTS